ncbi:Rrf2 family transcriptional regulator [Paenibacillus polysaccharolyticus]|uniref:Rrf2 family protein n=2 Tax=Paenibacillus TaxID=44249 RepID=A0A1G5GZ14_9BACL|nr:MULTISPECIES: Rrf2 family transcriptional regulator [Paenibacillus]MBY0206214.1 Rrf2 family transcriptional regulator [Paenibacillus cucumis (ex Kampfer et al. 2016)]MCP1136385.1 Rrf2 family transcriptional regulator [Paenibacillus polysaccharolyticus]MDP9700952.1 Rrf2 family protein [Paenibacillus intestini]SCY56661.1 Rrf2 family protein [Paenibacillus polysaccharolyticus]
MNSEFTIAVHCLVFLSMRSECMANSEDLSQSVGTHPARVRKVLSVLRKHGYLTTKEGAHGGYLLSRPSEEIKLGEVYRLVAGGSLGPSWCSGESGSPCKVSSNMQGVMGAIYDGGEEALSAYFDRISILDVMQSIERGEGPFPMEGVSTKEKI